MKFTPFLVALALSAIPGSFAARRSKKCCPPVKKCFPGPDPCATEEDYTDYSARVPGKHSHRGQTGVSSIKSQAGAGATGAVLFSPGSGAGGIPTAAAIPTSYVGADGMCDCDDVEDDLFDHEPSDLQRPSFSVADGMEHLGDWIDYLKLKSGADPVQMATNRAREYAEKLRDAHRKQERSLKDTNSDLRDEVLGTLRSMLLKAARRQDALDRRDQELENRMNEMRKLKRQMKRAENQKEFLTGMLNAGAKAPVKVLAKKILDNARAMGGSPGDAAAFDWLEKVVKAAPDAKKAS